jgi:hypothetical protein
VIADEILVDLKEGIKSEFIIPKLLKYELKVDKVVSPDLNIILYKFNSRKISVEELVVKVKELEGVENAQTNKIMAQLYFLGTKQIIEIT